MNKTRVTRTVGFIIGMTYLPTLGSATRQILILPLVLDIAEHVPQRRFLFSPVQQKGMDSDGRVFHSSQRPTEGPGRSETGLELGAFFSGFSLPLAANCSSRSEIEEGTKLCVDDREKISWCLVLLLM